VYWEDILHGHQSETIVPGCVRASKISFIFFGCSPYEIRTTAKMAPCDAMIEKFISLHFHHH
jgi:hypothetical protein